MTGFALAKYRQIGEQLAEAIRSGAYAPGAKLPTERELAERFGVHRMTVRQATASLVVQGLVVKRLPSGIFVRDDTPVQSERRVNLICPEGDHAQAHGFIREGSRQAAELNLRPRVIRVYPGDEHVAGDAISSPDPSLLFGMPVDSRGPLMRHIRAARSRLVLLGGRMDHAGIASVIGDDDLGLRLAVQHLQEHGHRRIALVCSIPGHRTLMEVQVQRFQHALEVAGLGHGQPQEILRLDENLSGAESEIGAAATTVQAYLKQRRGSATAFIGLSEEVAFGATSALYAAGRRVPEAASVIAYAGTSRTTYAIPPHTFVDIGIARHVRAAFEMIEEMRAAPGAGRRSSKQSLRTVRPVLVEGATVAAASTRRSPGRARAAATAGRPQ